MRFTAGVTVLLALSVVILDEVLQQVHPLLGFNLIHFDQILLDTKRHSCQSDLLMENSTMSVQSESLESRLGSVDPTSAHKSADKMSIETGLISSLTGRTFSKTGVSLTVMCTAACRGRCQETGTSHVCSWKSLLSFSISSAISAPVISVRIIPCCFACSLFSFSIFVLKNTNR